VANPGEDQILQLRTDRDFSRRAAAAFCRDNIGNLKQQGFEPTFAHLRLAFLLGAGDAVRLIQAEPQTRVVQILAGPVIRANPFMVRMTAADLLAKSVRDVERDRADMAVPRPEPRTRPLVQARPASESRRFAMAREKLQSKACIVS
jgi:hypothetical protein